MAFKTSVRLVQLKGERESCDPGKEQRDPDPYDDCRGSDDQRLEKYPQSAQDKQDTGEDGPTRAGYLQCVHVPAQTDGTEPSQEKPESQKYGQRSCRKGYVEDQNQAKNDLDDTARENPAASGYEVPVCSREHHFKYTRHKHHPSEKQRHSQIALGWENEDQNAEDKQGDADEQR